MPEICRWIDTEGLISNQRGVVCSHDISTSATKEIAFSDVVDVVKHGIASWCVMVCPFTTTTNNTPPILPVPRWMAKNLEAKSPGLRVTNEHGR